MEYMRNYFDGDAQAPVPPAYFLQRLYDYDALLVMFPSQVHPGTYVLARRRERTAGLTSAALAVVANPDTRTCMAMGWVPVCSVYQTGISWDPDQIIKRLMARDIRMQGGAEAVADREEAAEEADRLALKASIREDQWNRSGDAWRSYQHRTGQTTIRSKDYFLSKLSRSGAANQTVPTSRSTAGLGAECPA